MRHAGHVAAQLAIVGELRQQLFGLLQGMVEILLAHQLPDLVADFREIKRLVKGVVDRLDHQYLNDVPPFTGVNPTTENVARFVYDDLAKTLPGGLTLASVTAWESQNCGATYSG